MTQPKRSLEEIAVACHRRIWPRCPEDERGPDVAEILAALREAADAARQEEREALRETRLAFDVSQDVLSTAQQWHGRRCAKDDVHEHALLRRLEAVIKSNEELFSRLDARSRPKEPKP